MPKTGNNTLSLVEMEELLGEQHIGTSYDTPMREDAFDRTDEEKIAVISRHFREIMNTLGLDLTDDSLRGTPGRVAKMFVKEIFSGLDPRNKPAVTLFENKYNYRQMLVEKKHNGLLKLRAPFCSDYRKSACCLYFCRQSHRLIEIKPHRSVLLETAAGAGKVNHPDRK